MKGMRTILLFLLLSFKALAHPVIYQDGLALSSYNMEKIANQYAVYSVTPRLSLGVESWRFDSKSLGFLKTNQLLWRRNGEDSQANLYSHAGFGGEGTLQLGLEGDWETRHLYTSLKHLEFHNRRGFDERMTQARVGFSPRRAGFNELQVWVMLQAMVTREVGPEAMLTPMVRFFYHNVLWEVGSSLKGEWMLNLMVHL